eukprot:4564176-Alexandrium_andersonii.AAC.1
MESRPACFWQLNSELPFRKCFTGAAGLESASGCNQIVVRWHFGSSPSLRQCSPCVGRALVFGPQWLSPRSACGLGVPGGAAP